MDKASLIYPMFVVEGTGIRSEIPSMPGQYHYSPDLLPAALEEVKDAGVSAVMLFGIPDRKDELGSAAWAEDGIIQKALAVAKREVPELIISRMYACVSTHPTDIAERSAVMMWIMTRPCRFLPERRCPMCRPGQTWWLLPI